MALLPPRVIGPVSVCNNSILVEGQLTGATVEIFSNGSPVAHGAATSANQVFALSPGTVLHAGENVTARQRTESEVSPQSPDQVTVQKKPQSIGTVVFANPIYECGQCTGIVGAVPGATVEVRVQTGNTTSVRGSGVAPDGEVGMMLSPATGGGDILIAQQTACGTHGVDTHAPRPDQTSKLLPTPVIKGTLRACQPTVTIDKNLAGATVTVKRSSGGGSSLAGCFTGGPVNFPVTPPLVEGETITVSQAFPTCHYQSDESAAVTVMATEPIPPPLLAGPLCAGATSVSLSKLIAGAQVQILNGDTVLGTGEAPDSAFVFPLPAGLASGNVVTAKQGLCGHWSQKSNAVTVHAIGGALPTPHLVGPLHECAGAVRVKNVQPGAWVYVWSSALAAPIGQRFATGTQVDVAVTPVLIAGDHVHAQIKGCGGTSQNSAEIGVSAAPGRLPPPTVVKPVEQMTFVDVAHIESGALVEVYVNDVWVGGRVSAASTATVAIGSPLVIGDKVKARQRLCTLVSKFGDEVVTVPLPPTAFFTATPTDGTVPLTVMFIDRSTGVVDHWSWNFGDGGTSSVQNPTHLYSASHGGVYTVTLTVSNAGGSGSATLTITARPLPPVAHFTASPTSGQAPLTVQFTDQSTGVIDTWLWSFDDGGTSPVQSPSHVYNAGGNFTVGLTVHNLGGDSSTQQVIAVAAPPPVTPFVWASVGNQLVTVNGSHFPPNAGVTIELFDDAHHQQVYGTQANSVGAFTVPISVTGCTGGNSNPLHIKATADNVTWSNTATVIC